MTIDELNALTTLTATDEVPVWDSEESGEPTKKITAQNMANSVKTLANLQGALIFDSTPTTGSTNPVTSGGVANAITQSTAETNLYVGAASSSGTTYTLTEAITNFKYIRIAFSTNSEWTYVTVPVSTINVGTSYSVYATYNGSNQTGEVTNWAYITTCFVNFPSATSFKPTILYSNVNLQLKPRIITGIGRISQ